MTPNFGLDDLKKDLELCTKHLQDEPDAKARLEQRFVILALVRIYGECQKCLREAMVCRAKKSRDHRLAQYVGISLQRLGMGAHALRRDIFGIFGDRKAVSSVPTLAWETYERLRRIRNSVVHGEKTDVRLDDVMRMHHMAQSVVLTMQTLLLDGTEQGHVSHGAESQDRK